MAILPHDSIPDDPSRATDPTWAEMEAQLRAAGLDWSDLSSWTIGPTPEDLDLTPNQLAAMASVGKGPGE